MSFEKDHRRQENDSNDISLYPDLYPWQHNSSRFDGWWVNANVQTSPEVLRRPSLARHPSVENMLECKGCDRADGLPETYSSKPEYSKPTPPSSDVNVLPSYDDATSCSSMKSHIDNDLPPYDDATSCSSMKPHIDNEIEIQDDYIKHKFGLHRFLIIPDGNCMYRALAQALVHDQSQHLFLRREIVQFIRHNRSDYENIIEGSFQHFLNEASKENVWGGYVELMAFTRLLSINIIVVTGGCPSNPDVSVTCHHYNPHNEPITPKDTVWLSWISSGHYDAILDRVFENKYYDEWMQKQNEQLESDAAMAIDLTFQGDSKASWCIVPPKSPSAILLPSTSQTSNSATSQQNSDWRLQQDEQLARTLQEEEDAAYMEQFS